MNGKTMAAAPALFGMVLTLVSCSVAWAQDPVLDELYGQGVHYYFANRVFEAHKSLSAAVDQGSKDPRCHYFRGLCSLRIGDSAAAEKDFQNGAKLEATGRDRIYPVGRSLQRIQGQARLTLEQHRRGARIAARLEAIRVQQARYEELKRAEDEVVRDPNRKPVPLPGGVIGNVPPAVDPTDPFAKDAPPAQPAPPKPAETAPAQPKPAEALAPPPAAAPAPSTAPDPFDTPSTPAPADDDPFGPAPTDDDPFGATPAPAATPPPVSPATPPPASPATPPPASDDDDPFADPF